MPSSAISALHNTVTSASGMITQRVMRSERNIHRHSSVTEANSAPLTSLSPACTTSLVAAMTPTLPEASWNVT
ncbi:hypothetical protein D3C86_1706870 [compost metagenome]